VCIATYQLCSKKLKAALPDRLSFYEIEKGPSSDILRGRLYSLSLSTIDRRLGRYGEDLNRRGILSPNWRLKLTPSREIKMAKLATKFY
jgi:hypothetical protein